MATKHKLYVEPGQSLQTFFSSKWEKYYVGAAYVILNSKINLKIIFKKEYARVLNPRITYKSGNVLIS